MTGQPAVDGSGGIADTGASPVILDLYVAARVDGDNPALHHVEAIRCRVARHTPCRVEVHDLTESPRAARQHRIVVTPTLIRRTPPPERRVVGDLSDPERILRSLGLLSAPGPQPAEESSRSASSQQPRASSLDVVQAATGRDGDELPRLRLGVDGFERIAYGGLPRNRLTLVSGGPGTGKTVLSCQFLAAGIEDGDVGVYVAVEETPASVRRNAELLGFDVGGWEEQHRWHFLDAGVRDGAAVSRAGDYDFGGLLAQVGEIVEEAADRHVRVVVDSLSAVFLTYADQATVRSALLQLVHRLDELGVSTVVTAERTHRDDSSPRYSLEDYVSETLLVLRLKQAGEHRRRTLEIVKARGCAHQIGEFPFALADGGLTMLPGSSEQEEGSAPERVPWGIPDLDEMCPRGVFRDSLLVVAGPTGSGKTTLGVLCAAASDRSTLVSFEESTGQLRRNAAALGVQMADAVDEGRVVLMAASPEDANLEDHYLWIAGHLQERRPQRMVIDGLAALERIATGRSFRQFVLRLAALVKSTSTLLLCTYNIGGSGGGSQVTGAQVSTVTDGIVILSYFRNGAQIGRSLHILKLRGVEHDTTVRESRLTDGGLRLVDLVDGGDGAEPVVAFLGPQ